MLSNPVNKNFGIPLIGLLCLIVFDTLQQKYYLDTFELTDTPVLFSDLLINHAIRWFVWLLTALPLLLFLRRNLNSYSLVFLIIGLCGLSVSLISAQSIISQGLSFHESFSEFFIFFTFQKGLTFAFSYFLLILTISAHQKSKALKEASERIVELIHERKSKELPILQVKTGKKIRKVDLKDVSWIQSDDYCVRIHSADNQVHVVRKSLKEFEKELKPYRFIRVHRSALLNLNYIDQINVEKSTVKLTDESEVSASRSGIKLLKESLQFNTL